MSVNTYYSGTLVQTTATFNNADGVPTDPSTITLKYQIQGTAAVTLVYGSSEIERVSAGIYYYQFNTTGWAGPGNQLYTLEWIGTGTVQAPGVDSFEIQPLPI
jgi:hypothetical protein